MSADYPFSPFQGASVTLSATTTGSDVTKVNAGGNSFRCSNRSTTQWMRVFFSADPAVIGAEGGAPAITPLTKYGLSIPPSGVAIYKAQCNANYYATAWVESGAAANCVIEPGI